MALTRNDKGPEVERLQQALIDLGGDLPRYGVDGWLGTETLRARRARRMSPWRKLWQDTRGIPTAWSVRSDTIFMKARGREVRGIRDSRIPPFGIRPSIGIFFGWRASGH
jgi:peptidoglycan hydrolase-like protein with peptidoglycan-binding domain